MYIQKRIYGIENELGIVMQQPDGSWAVVRSGQVQEQYHRDATSIFPHAKPARLWHSNGSCSYTDMGHPEHATPECYLVKDAVRYAKAGELLISGIFSRPFPDGSRIVLFKNNVGCDEHGSVNAHFGCHENYLVHGLDFQNEATRKKFIPFLITRQIMDGAGWWEHNGTFLFSQRSIAMETAIGRTTTTTRPLITIKETMNDTGPCRLHLILGDANILDVACFLKLGTTSLVLSMIELGCAPIIECQYPVATMKLIAKEPDTTVPNGTLVMHGKILSALDVQVIYCQAARRMLCASMHESEEARSELFVVLDMWEHALNAIYAHDWQWMFGRLDWATKQYLAQCAINAWRISFQSDIRSIRKTIDILYHNITHRTLQERINVRWPDRRLCTDQQIEKARYFPPQGTRARMRGLFVASILDKENRIRSDINWISCKDGDLPLHLNACAFNDPFAPSSNQFIEFLLGSLALPHSSIFSPQYMGDC